MISTSIPAGQRPSRRHRDAPAHYVTWRRVVIVAATLLAGWLSALANAFALAVMFLEVPYEGVEAVACNVAMYAPLVILVCLLGAALSPSHGWSRRFTRTALLPAGLWAICWLVVLAGT